MNGRELIAGAVSLASGSITGRVRMQKVMYLLSKKGLGGPFRFSYHHYGPFSRDVDEAISDAKAFCGLRELTRRRTMDGAPFSVFELSDTTSYIPGSFLGALPAAQVRVDLARMNEVSSTVIEVAATIFWLRFEENIVEWQDELVKRKGAKAAKERVEQALSLLKMLGLDEGPSMN